MLLRDRHGTEVLRNYYERYAAIAMRHRTGFVLESAAWRASADWGDLLGYDVAVLAAINRDAIDLLHEIRAASGPKDGWIVSGCVGPRGDGHDPAKQMTVEQARACRQAQIDTFAAAGADLTTAITMNYVDEAIGIARAARGAGIPVAISFTVETDGRLPTGQSLGDAIAAVDAATDAGPVYYMINCAHPRHFAPALLSGESWVRPDPRPARERLDAEPRRAQRGRAARSRQPARARRRASRAAGPARLPQINVLGGCCGTDHRHVGAIAAACCGAEAEGALLRSRTAAIG